ncbi:MAG: AraC family transcriptional regulator [Lachnospiraceae bacterium]|nr:AraC family transcriptional regulator [Lachnospiraceae bacterium]
MKEPITNIFKEEFNPAFLFTWKGRRTRDEIYYHAHDHLEIAFILSGCGRYRIDGELYDVEEGDLLILNPHVLHQGLVKSEENPATEFFVGAAELWLQGFAENTLPTPDDGPILHTQGELRQKIFRLCTSMESEKTADWEGRYFMMKAYMMQLLLLVLKTRMEPEEITDGRSFESVNKKYVVEQILDYFEDHYAEKISLDRIAGNMYLSPFYISRIFKSEVGDTPIRHLINIRLEKAMELMQSGFSGSIQEVAARVGYEDAYHFSKLFKKRYGYPPSQVKRKKSSDLL